MNTPMVTKTNGPPISARDRRFELLLFRLGEDTGLKQRELFGINVFKVREIVVAPHITSIVNAPKHNLGLANVRGQLIPVIDLPGVVGCVPQTDSRIVLVTEFARTTQAFLVDEVVEIVQLDWKHLQSADSSGAGLISGIARLDGDAPDSRLAQVLDVEQILRDVAPATQGAVVDHSTLSELHLPEGSSILFVDDSAVARALIEEGLKSMHLPFQVAKNGKEAWERLAVIQSEAVAQGKTARDKVAMVLTDLEMPEMDGYSLTHSIKQDPRFAGIPVIIYSSLTGTASQVHANSVGADDYVAKFEPKELRESIRKVLLHRDS